MGKTKQRPVTREPEQGALELGEVVGPRNGGGEEYLKRWRAKVRIVPAWTGPPGWVIAWKIHLGKREAMPRPRPAGNEHAARWWHEDPVPRLADALAIVKDTDFGTGPDWRARRLFTPERV
jgi:hypothetical protein